MPDNVLSNTLAWLTVTATDIKCNYCGVVQSFNISTNELQKFSEIHYWCIFDKLHKENTEKIEGGSSNV